MTVTPEFVLSDDDVVVSADHAPTAAPTTTSRPVPRVSPTPLAIPRQVDGELARGVVHPGDDGTPTAWSMRVVTSSIFHSVGRKWPANKVEPQTVAGLEDNGYNVPNTRVQSLVKNTHLPVWFWRSPGANQHVFAIESFVDEMAAANGIDPYQMRRKLLAGKSDWLKVLDTAAEKWDDWQRRFPSSFLEGYSALLKTRILQGRNPPLAAKVAAAFAKSVPDSPYSPQLLDIASKLLAKSDKAQSDALRQLLQSKYPEDPLAQPQKSGSGGSK